MPLALAILGNLNVALPAIVSFVTIFHHKDGTATVVTELTEEAAASSELKKLVADWSSAHPNTPVKTA